MDEVAAILFDTFGTVVDWRGSLIAELTGWAAARGIGGDLVTLIDDWRAAYAPSMDRVRKGEAPWTSLDDLQLASLRTLVDAQGIEGLTEDDLTHLTRAWHRLRPWPDSVPGLTRLHRRFILAPLSNGNVSLLIDMARHASLPWDMIFGADVFGHYKPDAQTYRGACRLLSRPPSHVMLCAAHNYDLEAAQTLGLRTAFIPRPSEYGPRQTRDLAPTGAWDIVAADLEDLATKMGA